MAADVAIPAVTAEQMATVDRMMVEKWGLDVLQIMEMAGWVVAAFARDHFFGGDPRGKQVQVLAGTGGNGGDGMVAARHLSGWGAMVAVQLAREPHEPSVTAHQLRVLRNLGMEILPADAEPDVSALIIDALLGFSLRSAPAGETRALIERVNALDCPILAVDLPSGLNATDGTVYDPCIVADATLTLALPKTGLLSPSATHVVGELFVADIGVPAATYAELGLDVGPLFARSSWRHLPAAGAAKRH